MKTFDKVSMPITERLHFDGDKKESKSGIGGCLTLLIYAFMLYFTGRNAQRMITNYKPYIYQMERSVNNETDAVSNRRVYLNESSKFYFYVWDY